MTATYHSQAPTLLPNFNPQVTGNGTLSNVSPANLLAEFPRTPSSTSAVIGGTITAGDTVSLKINAAVLPNDLLEVTYTVLSSDTVDTIAAALADLINESLVAQQFGYFATVDLATVTVNQQSAVGNFATVTSAVTGSATETVTIATPALSGGAGPTIPLDNFGYVYNGSNLMFWMYKPVELDYALLSSLCTQGYPVI